MRILAVENSEAALQVLKQQIGAAFPGEVCDGFSDPLLAIKSFLAFPPDLTVFCRDMRIIDGFTFARTLRCRYPDFTGVMLGEDESSRADAQKYFLEYLVKPADAAELKKTWEKLHASL